MSVLHKFGVPTSISKHLKFDDLGLAVMVHACFENAEEDKRNNLPSSLGHDLRSERKTLLVRCATLASNGD